MRILALFLAFASTLLLPALALAQSVITGENLPPTTLSIDGCAAAYGMPVQDWYLTTLVVFCIKETIKAATVAFITLVLTALRDTIAVLFCLAVVFYGIRVMMQDQDLPRMSFGFLMRLTIVVGVSFNLPTFVAWPFEILEDMLVMGTGGWSPWLQIDNAVGQLLGFGPGRSLFQGVLGLIGAALYTSATGMFMFLFGFLIIFSLLGLVYRAVYNYLNAIVLIGFLMCVSPLIVPLAVFGYGERYLRKWLDLLVSAMLQPFMLFAFLWIFLGMVDVYVSAIFSLLGGNDFSAFWRTNQPFFSWAMTTDPQLFQKFENQGMEKGNPLVQQLMNPLLGRSMDMSIINHPGVDFGPNSMAIMQQLILTFIGMAITLYLLRSMLDAIPKLADDIAGTSTGLGFDKIEFVENMKKAVAKVSAKGAG